MKTVLTFLFTITFFVSNAQIPNNGFENWTNQGTYFTPDDWGNLNPYTAILNVFTCQKGTPGNPGSSYLKLITKSLIGISVMPGIALTGEIDTALNLNGGGFPFTERPLSLTGKWQYMAYGIDQGFIGAALTRWNVTNQSRDTIAMITYALPGMVMAWGNFSLPFTYRNGYVPDTAFIILSASGAKPVVGSYLYADNLAFTGTAGIPEASLSDRFFLFPNPASNAVTVNYNAKEVAPVNISIFDLNGKLVDEFNPGYAAYGENREVLKLQDLAAGTYMLQLSVGHKILTDKLIIK